TYNNGTGIITSGTNVQIKCGSIRYNDSYGVELKTNGTLTMCPELNSGHVNLSSNNHLSLKLDNAKGLNIYNGFNNFSGPFDADGKCLAGTSTCIKTIDRTMLLDYNLCENFDCSDIHINANNNQWVSNASFNIPSTFPRHNMEYFLETSYNCHYNQYTQGPRRKIFLDDAAPQNSSPCPIELVEPHPYDLLAYCDGCIVINTENFPSVALNIAIKSAIEAIALEDEGFSLANTEAVNLFSEIFEYVFANDSLLTEDDFVRLKISYQYMLQALGAAFLFNEISDSPGFAADQTVQKVLDVQDYFLSQIHPCDPVLIHDKFSILMEKGQVLRMAGHRDDALAIFDDVLNWADYDDHEFVESWQCATMHEIDFKNEAITFSQYSALLDDCPKLTGTQPSQGLYFVTSIKEEEKESHFKIVPNPARNSATISFSDLTGHAEILIVNMLGQHVEKIQINSGNQHVLDCSGYAPGIYQVILRNGDKIQSKKLLINR
nr:T9SS type A sorting domain-containing protein [Bacteroidota bacterium]